MSTLAYAQPTSVTLTATQDSYIDSRLPTGNYGSNTTMQSATYLNGLTYYYRRSFVEFDLSSIPSNAVIYSATLKMTRSTTVTGSATWKTKMIKTSWAESTIKANLQPTISAIAQDIVSSNPSASGYVDSMDVKSMVQRMVRGQVSNYGWSVQLANEAYAGASGATFHTSEATTSDNRPKLIVKYYTTPLLLADASITHESNAGANDGSIDIDISGGVSSSYTYSWINGSTGSVISTASTLSSVGDGWYGVHVYGSYDEHLYYGFLVGTECDTVTISYLPDQNYTLNNYIFNGVLSGIDYKQLNYANNANFMASHYNTSGTFWQTESYLDFQLWMDPRFVVQAADLTLQGNAHVMSGSRTNASELLQVTSDWCEECVTYNIQPTRTNTISAAVPATTTATEDRTVDISSFWDFWKGNNAANYGMKFQLQDTITDFNVTQNYHSPANGTPANRPAISFVLELYTGMEGLCAEPYIKLERKLTGLKYASKDDKIYFAYDNEYASTSANLSYNIFSVDNRLTPLISGGTSALSLEFGYNNFELNVSTLTTGEIYILEATNDRGEKWFLRFEKD